MFSLFLLFSFCLLPNSIQSQQLDFVCSQCGKNFGNYVAFKQHFNDAYGFDDHYPLIETSYFRRDPMLYLIGIEKHEAAEGSSHGETSDGRSRGTLARITHFLRGKQKHSAHPPPPPPRVNHCSLHLPHCTHHHLPQAENPMNQVLFFNTPTPNQQETFHKQYCAERLNKALWWGFKSSNWGKEFSANGEIWKPIKDEKIPGDGHCFFSAISLVLMGDADCGSVIRAMVGNPDDEDASEKKHGEVPIRYGENNDIIAVVKFYKVNIVVYYVNTSEWYFYSPKSEDEGKMCYDPEYPTIPLVLEYNHFNVITMI